MHTTRHVSAPFKLTEILFGSNEVIRFPASEKRPEIIVIQSQVSTSSNTVLIMSCIHFILSRADKGNSGIIPRGPVERKEVEGGDAKKGDVEDLREGIDEGEPDPYSREGSGPEAGIGSLDGVYIPSQPSQEEIAH